MISDRDLEQLLRAALKDAPSSCPPLDQLAAARSPEMGAIAAHVLGCADCQAVVAAATSPLRDSVPQATIAALERRAISLFARVRPNVLRVIVEALGRQLRVLELIGEALEPVPVRSARSEDILVRQRFGDHAITAHISCADTRRFGILLDVWGDSLRDTVRFSLFRGERELASDVPRGGRVQLPTVPAGAYRVAVSDERGYLGDFELDLRVCHA